MGNQWDKQNITNTMVGLNPVLLLRTVNVNVTLNIQAPDNGTLTHMKQNG